MIWWPLIMHVIQSYCKPLLFYLYASECFTWPVVRRGDATCTEKCSGALVKLLLVGVHWTKSWEIVTCSLSFSSCSTNLVINGLNKTSTQVNCIGFLCFSSSLLCHSFYCFVCLSVTQCLSVRLLPLWRIKIYILLHRCWFSQFKTIQPIQQLE